MKNLFKNRTLIITGVGRSGSTILSKLVGSMKPSFILFEPAIMKFMTSFPFSEVFTRILFEDYFLNLIHGRGNMNPNDWSCMTNYEPEHKIKARQNALRRRSDALDYIKDHNPWWIIKSLEFSHLMDWAHAHFGGARYIHIIRNGRQVIRSSMERGWYTDDFCNNDIVEQTYWDEKVRVPHFIEDPNDRELWPYWTPITRCACAWRHLVVQANRYKRKNNETCLQFRYEDFIKNPEKYANHISRKFGLTITTITAKHIDDIVKFDGKEKPPIDVNLIEQPEREKFLKLNGKLGYS